MEGGEGKNQRARERAWWEGGVYFESKFRTCTTPETSPGPLILKNYILRQRWVWIKRGVNVI